MRWERVGDTHGIWQLTGASGFAACVMMANLAPEGQGARWCWYADVNVKGQVETAVEAFASEADARAWCEERILPEVRIVELKELA